MLSFSLCAKTADSFYPELTLDHKTSLSGPTNTSPWFVSSTHIDPWVLHTNIWDHQVPCAEHLDSLHTDGTAICSGEKGEKEFTVCRAAKKGLVGERGVCTTVKIRVGLNRQQGIPVRRVVRLQPQVDRGSASCGSPWGQGCSVHREVCGHWVCISVSDLHAIVFNSRLRWLGCICLQNESSGFLMFYNEFMCFYGNCFSNGCSVN